jgi:uncharacterized protein YjbI with pentapeptide repeats
MAAPDPIPDLLKAVNEASARGFALWVTFLSVIAYLAVSIGTTTHAQLLLEGPLKLPLLGVDLPLLSFYQVAPALFLIMHFYVLLQLCLLSRSLRLFDSELHSAQLIQKDRERIRAQLDKFVLTQTLVAAPPGWALRQSLRIVVWLTLLVAPVVLLLSFQIRFLPYHNVPTIWAQRMVLLLDILVIWVMWPAITSGAVSQGNQSRVARAVLALGCGVLAAFAVLVASVPGEAVEQAELDLGWLIHSEKGRQMWWPTWRLFEGKPDPVRSKTSSVFSRNLILVNNQLIGLDDDRLAKVTRTLSLRGRDLRFAVLSLIDLRKADLEGAQLQGASLDDAQLEGAYLLDAQLQGASLTGASLEGAFALRAQLQGASLSCRVEDFGYCTNLKGAVLGGANLQGADLHGADLQGAILSSAQLQGAVLQNAKLQGANLGAAELQGATLRKAKLQGAFLDVAQLQGASLDDAQLQGASLFGAQLQGASLVGAQLQGASLVYVFAWRADLAGAALENARVAGVILEPKRPCPDKPETCDWTSASAHGLRQHIEQAVPAGNRRDALLTWLDARLDPGKPLEEEEELAAHWRAALTSIPSQDAFEEERVQQWQQVGCAAVGAPYVLAALAARIETEFSDKARGRLAAAFAAPGCAGARGLSEEAQAKLVAVSQPAAALTVFLPDSR